MPPRYVPDLPLPPYAYVPGRFPHPTRDPGGHHFGARLPSPRGFDPARWRDCGAFLAGVDLFNHGYYWEAHEAWEGLWRASRAADRARAGSPLAAGASRAAASPATGFLQALIKLAAAGFKARQGRPEGVLRHAAVAAALLREVEALEREFMGLRVAALAERAEAIAALDRARVESLCRGDALIVNLSAG